MIRVNVALDAQPSVRATITDTTVQVDSVTQVVRIVGTDLVGPAGPAGALVSSGTALGWLHEQSDAQRYWPIEHNLGGFPSVTVIDTSGVEYDPDIHFVDGNNILIDNGWPTSGVASLMLVKP